MCGLCGIFGVADHWSDGPGAAVVLSRRAERQHRVRTANALLGLYGLKLAEWQSRYTLTGPTGRREVIDHVGAVWPAAERLAGRRLDPLDPALLVRLEAMVT
jgi:hypothetical protein